MEQELKKYIGTKEVKAIPMTYGEFVKETGHAYEGHKDDEHGYMVEYKDGYRGWSPAHPFQEAYRPSESTLDKLIIEKENLRSKLTELRIPPTHELSQFESHLRDAQLSAMDTYLAVLRMRIGIELEKDRNSAHSCSCGEVLPAPGCPEDPYEGKCCESRPADQCATCDGSAN